MIRLVLPERLWARFALLLLVSLVCANLIAAVLIAREGTVLDQTVRVERDLGRLVALVETLETADTETGRAVLDRSGTGYTRFSLDPQTIIPKDAQMLHDLAEHIGQIIPGREVRVASGMAEDTQHRRMPLVILSVRLAEGVHADMWLNSLVYPLTTPTVWTWKAGFFVPLIVSLVGSLIVGVWFTRRMTEPLRRIADAALAAGSGNRLTRLPETGAIELRNVARAFNGMQRRISEFDASRQQMVAAIGHDLRTPITSLRLRVSLSSDDEVKPDMIRILDEMSIMAQDLVTYARSSDSSEEPADLELRSLVSRICSEQGAEMTAGIPVRLTVRQVAISRAIRNLIGNAMRYAGSAQVSIRQSASNIIISVMDRGPGLPEPLLEKMKQPFVRYETSRSSETGGAGLGLAITEKIARDHGGQLRLRNRQGGGLEAELILPNG